MSLFGKIGAFGQVTTTSQAGWWPGIHHSRKTATGLSVSPESSFALSAYYACVRNIAEDISALPFKVFERLENDVREPLPKSDLAKLLRNPSPSLTRFDTTGMSGPNFWEMLIHWQLGWGNGVAEIERNGANKVTALHGIHPSRVEIKRDRDTQRVTYEIHNDDHSKTILRPHEVLHLRGIGDELSGYSVARIGAESMGRALATQEYSSAFFGNGSTFSGIYTTPGKLDKDARQRLKDSWPTGLPSAHDPLFLEADLKWQPLAVNPKDSQMIDVMRFTVEDVARWFRMPLHKIQSMISSTDNNIEQQAHEYVGDTLVPHVNRLEKQVDLKLIPERDRGRIFTKVIIRGKLRGDLEAQGDFYTKMFHISAMSPNDIRRMEDWNPVEGGDQYFVPVNMIPVDMARENAEAMQNGQGGADNDEQDKNEPGRFGGASAESIALMKKGHARMIADISGRLARKEQNALQRAAKRFTTDKAFAAWSEKFYAEHIEHAYESLITVALSLVECVSAAHGVVPAPSAVIEATEGFVKSWITIAPIPNARVARGLAETMAVDEPSVAALEMPDKIVELVLDGLKVEQVGC